MLQLIFKGNTITQDPQTEFFKRGKILFLCFQKESLPSSHWDPEVTLHACLHHALRSRACIGHSYTHHILIHTELNFSGPSPFLPSALIRITRLGKVYKRENLSHTNSSHIPKSWPWRKTVSVKMNEWGQGRGNTIRLCTRHNSWAVQPQANGLTSLCLNFLTCKTCVITVPTLTGLLWKLNEWIYKHF